MKAPSRLKSISIALALGILLLAMGCPELLQRSPDTAGLALTFFGPPDSGDDSNGQFPVDTFRIYSLLFQLDTSNNHWIKNRSGGERIDPNAEKPVELDMVFRDLAPGHYLWIAQASTAAYFHPWYIPEIRATAHGELDMEADRDYFVDVRFPLRDAHIILEVGDADPEAIAYILGIKDLTGTYDVATSHWLHDDDDPLACDSLVPSGDYVYWAQSFVDYPSGSEDGLSQTITGPVHVESGETKTVVVDFDTQPAPDPPDGTEAEFFPPKSIRICWEPVAGADSYNLYWATTAGVIKEEDTKIEGVTSCYIHDSVQFGFTYYYVVTAVKGSKESAESMEVFVELKG